SDIEGTLPFWTMRGRAIFARPASHSTRDGSNHSMSSPTSSSLTSNLKALHPALAILIGASLLLSVSMGLRQSLGIFMQPLTHDIGITVSNFTLAVAVQNLAWGFLQPVAGAWTDRYGFRPVMLVGALLYVAGLATLASAHGFVSILIGAGVLIGVS